MGRNSQKSFEVEREETSNLKREDSFKADQTWSQSNQTSIKTVLMPTEARERAKFVASLVLSYMEIVDETLVDLVPKLVMKCLVYKFRDGVAAGYSLYRKLRGVEHLMRRDQEKLDKVKMTRERMLALETALDIATRIQAKCL